MDKVRRHTGHWGRARRMRTLSPEQLCLNRRVLHVQHGYRRHERREADVPAVDNRRTRLTQLRLALRSL